MRERIHSAITIKTSQKVLLSGCYVDNLYDYCEPFKIRKKKLISSVVKPLRASKMERYIAADTPTDKIILASPAGFQKNSSKEIAADVPTHLMMNAVPMSNLKCRNE